MSCSTSGPRMVRAPNYASPGPSAVVPSSPPTASYAAYARPMPTSTGPARMLSAAASSERLVPSACLVSNGVSVQSQGMLRSPSCGGGRLPYAEGSMVEYAQPPMTYFSPPVSVQPMMDTMEVLRTPYGQQQVEVFSRPPVQYAAAPMARHAQSVEAVEVIRGPGGFQEVVEIVRDDTEIFALRTQLEEKAILVAEYQRRNNELQTQQVELERLLGDAEGQTAQLRAERIQFQRTAEENQERISQQQNEIEMLMARNEEQSAIISEQAERIATLDRFVIDLELKNAQQLTEIHALQKYNEDLKQLAEQQAAKIIELEKLVEELRSTTPEPHHAPPPPQSNLSDDDKIDHKIKEFFRNHTDYQVEINKERPGFYAFAKPISKKVNMKIVGDEVLARVGGGWEEVWTWLGQERVKYLEAEGIMEKENKMEKKRSSRSPGLRSSGVQRQNSGR